MTDEEHIELAETLHNVKGKVALSGYHCDLLDELYGNWNVYEADSKKVHSVKTERVEVLWTNYSLSETTSMPL
jgi:DNA adenine methylase